MNLAHSLLPLVLLGVACSTDGPGTPGDGDTDAAQTQGSADTENDGQDDDGEDEDEAENDDGEDEDDSGTPETSGTDGGETSADGETTTTDPSTGDPDTTGDAETGDTAGGATGLQAFCERYFECGGTYYNDVEDCMDASTNYWGSCPAALAALDAFGDCMITIPCDEYDPDAYNPANTICSDEWSDLMQTDC